MGEWKTIDTAPKDGERILLHTCDASIPSIGFYDEYRKNWYGMGFNILTLNPTHWMPLPDAPTNSKEGI